MQGQYRKLAIAIATVLVILVVCVGILLAVRWPFTKVRVLQRLEGLLSSDMRCDRHQMTFFPSPGCDLENVAIVRGGTTLAQVPHLRMRTTWPNLLTLEHRLSHVDIDGLRVHLPKPLPPPIDRRHGKQQTTADEIRADDAVLEIEREGAPDNPLRFEFRELLVRNAGPGQKMALRTRLHTSEPPDDIELRAELGPFNPTERSKTPLSGSFTVSRADLSHFSGIAGFLNGSGRFHGELGKLTVSGKTDCDDFGVTSSEHTQALHARFRAVLNALRGDVVIEDVTGQFGDTEVKASGVIAGDKGKTATLKLHSDRSEVRDLLHMFSRAPVPTLSGPITFHARVVLPPGKDRFIRKVQLTGDFAIRHARFNKRQTRMKLNQLSARARKNAPNHEKNDPADAPDIVSEIRAGVVLRDGVARLSNISFHVPDATARGAGFYNLISKRVKFRGMVAMQATVSQASGGGLKSVLLKPFNGLFRKKNSNAGAVLPVSVTGVYPHPQFHVSLKPGASSTGQSAITGEQ